MNSFVLFVKLLDMWVVNLASLGIYVEPKGVRKNKLKVIENFANLFSL